MMFFHRVAFGEADDFTWAEQLYGQDGSTCVRETDHDIVLSLTCLKTPLLLGLKLSKALLLSGVKFCKVLCSINYPYINGHNIRC